jgi:hypothetical protein
MRVFLLWDGGTMEGVITEHSLAQEWAESSPTRGFTLELVDSPLRRETILFKIGKGQSKTATIIRSQTSPSDT